MQVTRWGINKASSEVMSGILNCVCPECGGSMGGAGREFKCQGRVSDGLASDLGTSLFGRTQSANIEGNQADLI